MSPAESSIMNEYVPEGMLSGGVQEVEESVMFAA
jgi:hypothetical protein